SDKRVLNEDFSPNHDQPTSADRLGDAAKPFAEETTDQNTGCRHREGRAPDRESDYDDVAVDEGQGDTDRHRIDARTNGRRYQDPQGMAVWFASTVGRACALPNHFTAYRRE